MLQSITGPSSQLRHIQRQLSPQSQLLRFLHTAAVLEPARGGSRDGQGGWGGVEVGMGEGGGGARARAFEDDKAVSSSLQRHLQRICIRISTAAVQCLLLSL